MQRTKRATFESLKSVIREEIAEIREDPVRWEKYLNASNRSKKELAWLGQVSKLLAKGGDDYLDRKIARAEDRENYRYYKHKVKEKARRAMNDLLKIVAISEVYDDSAWEEMFPVGNLALLVSAYVRREGLDMAQVLAGAIEGGMQAWLHDSAEWKLAQAFDYQVQVIMRSKPDLAAKLLLDAFQESVKDQGIVPKS